MKKRKTLLIAVLGLCALTLAADRLADYRPIDRSKQNRVVWSCDFESQQPGWTLRKGYTFRRGEGIDATGGLTLSRSAEEPYSFSKYRVKGLHPRTRCRLSAMVRAKGVTAKGKPHQGKIQMLGFDFYDGKTYLYSAYIPVMVTKGAADWKRYETTFEVPKGVTEASLCFFLKKPYACEAISWDDVKVEELGEIEPLLYPVLPKQLRLDGDGAVKMRVTDFDDERPVADLKLFATLPDGTEKQAPVEGKFARFTFGKLPAGETRVKFSLVDLKRKRVVAETEYPFFTVTEPAPAGAVTVDESGRLTVDGKPFFPLGFFVEWPPRIMAADLETMRSIGVNVILPYHSMRMRFPEHKGPEGVKALTRSLDELRKYDIKVIFSLLEITGTIHKVEKYDGLTDKKEIARRIVRALRNHPSLLGWYISDENTPETLGPVRDLRIDVNRLDPWHPVATLSNQPPYYPWFGPTGDFMMLDKYPVRAKSQPLSMTAVRECFEAEAKTLGLGPWWVPQCFSWGIYWRNDPYDSYRYPTEEDMRSQALLALNHRARAVVFYAWDSIFKHDKFEPGASKWFAPRVFNVVKLLRELENFFLADDAPKPIEVVPAEGAPSRVEAKLHTAGERTIVVVTADGPGKAQATIKVGRTGLKSRFGRTKEIGGGNYEFTGTDIASDILE